MVPWNANEDIALTRAYLVVRNTWVHEVDTPISFWHRVSGIFNNLTGTNDRSKDSIVHRWFLLWSRCLRWNVLYEATMERHPNVQEDIAIQLTRGDYYRAQMTNFNHFAS